VKDVTSWIDPFGLDPITVYHFTNKKGYNGIMGTGIIRQSDPGKRAKGAIDKPKGVCVTTLSPDQLKNVNLGKIGLTNEKTMFYVSFEIESTMIEQLDPRDSANRLYIPEDIHLRLCLINIS
jgi:hypothetical protein